VEVTVGHRAENVPGGAELVYSSAVKPGNLERSHARELGLRELRRGELLAEVAGLRRCIAVAGTHGKTTTAWMTVSALRGAGLDPGHVIGADLRDGQQSAAWAPGEWLVVETDESDRTFLALEPEIAVVTNVELEHTKQYGSLDEVRAAFADFLRRAKQIVIPARPDLRTLVEERTVEAFDVDEVVLGAWGARFRWRGRTVTLAVPGEHNVRNAAGALEACRLVGVDLDRAIQALAGFPGARRRLELVGQTPSGARVYEDYAIHANEMRAALSALRTVETGRVVAVFEPLLFTRTREMAPEMGRALAQADAVVVLELFAGSEAGEHHPGVSGRLVAQAATEYADGRPVVFAPTAVDAQRHLTAWLGATDACLVMGISGETLRLARALVDHG
jgi:UDP-N-acetylmuramate--alanine ligase